MISADNNEENSFDSLLILARLVEVKWVLVKISRNRGNCFRYATTTKIEPDRVADLCVNNRHTNRRPIGWCRHFALSRNAQYTEIVCGGEEKGIQKIITDQAH